MTLGAKGLITLYVNRSYKTEFPPKYFHNVALKFEAPRSAHSIFLEKCYYH
jgi:hypothetical protein